MALEGSHLQQVFDWYCFLELELQRLPECACTQAHFIYFVRNTDLQAELCAIVDFFIIFKFHPLLRLMRDSMMIPPRIILDKFL